MANRLVHETSPYLRQHANNPVDWFPWGDEAFAESRRRDRPILLSVGYSACHWCHVMAHESFEDHDIAAVMNDLYVNVKVDREERPDVDAIYMEAVQAMSGHGGWPMTVFLTPEGKPFFGGTYFPNRPGRGMMSFPELLARIDEVWSTRRDDLEQQATELTASIGRSNDLEAAEHLPSAAVFDESLLAFRRAFDPRWGGFGSAPKFPQAMGIDALLRHLARSPAPAGAASSGTQTQTRSEADNGAETMAEVSLRAMASGGIYDHLAGGFARYSTDEEWLAPHFEKMLYDNALLVRAFTHAWQRRGDADFRQVLNETVGYVLHDLTHPDGGFFSAEDADSEGVEGKFYVWDQAEVAEVLQRAGLTAAEIDQVAAWYDVTSVGNWEHHNILRRLPVDGGTPATAGTQIWPSLERPAVVERARGALLNVRNLRVRPGLDDKVLLEWNALMLAALAEAASATGDPAWHAAAVRNGEFLCRHLRTSEGRWLRSWQGPRTSPLEAGAGRAQHLAYAADHAALVDAFTRLAELTGEARWIDEARRTADALLHLFWDHDQGGVFTTGSDAEALVTRPKDIMDNATPSANSLAAFSLLRLGALTGEVRYTDHALAILRLLGPMAGRHALAFGHLLGALDLALTGLTEVVITGHRPDLVELVQRSYRPTVVLAWGERYPSPLWAGREEQDEDGRAYVCRGFVCDLPADTTAALTERLTSA